MDGSGAVLQTTGDDEVDVMETIIIAIISSGLLSVIITECFGLLKAKRSKKNGVEAKLEVLAEEQKEIRGLIKQQEKDALRTELKLMISDFPDEETDILRLAQHYFVKLEGNWTMANIFTKWCKDRGIDLPAWVKQ